MSLDLANRLEWACRIRGLPPAEREYRFAARIGRRWRFDLAWPAHMLAVECDGGTFVAGRHSRGTGAAKDAEKQNAAVILGWRVLRFTSADLTRERVCGLPVDVILAALEGKGDVPQRMRARRRKVSR